MQVRSCEFSRLSVRFSHFVSNLEKTFNFCIKFRIKWVKNGKSGGKWENEVLVKAKTETCARLPVSFYGFWLHVRLARLAATVVSNSYSGKGWDKDCSARGESFPLHTYACSIDYQTAPYAFCPSRDAGDAHGVPCLEKPQGAED